uniref:Sigma factor n=1 Tax=Hypseocharis bilobata TaxID=253189 RepID=A0A0G2STQ4_9ROSI|nr:sigma factor [Hypseocharis bilobata]
MAIATVCSSSPSCSPTLPTISLSSFKTHHHQSIPSTPSKFAVNLVSNEPLTIAEAAEAVALASASLEAAREAAMVAYESGEVGLCCGEGWGELERNESDWLKARMTRRRKRRKRLEGRENGEEDEEVPLIRSVKSGHLTPKQEAEFCMCLKEGARLEAQRRKLAEACKQEPSLKQLAMAMGMKKRNIDRILCNRRVSQETIIRTYRGLVVSIAIGYQGRGLSLQDLIQAGSIGLLRGAERFDPNRGYKLSTYVYWWVRQAIVKAVANDSRLIRLPGSVCDMLVKIAEAKNTLSIRLRRLPSYDEIAELLNVQVSTVRLICRRSRPPISLDRRIVTDQGCMTLQDIIPGPDERTPEKILKKQLIKQEVEKLLNTLSERESCILRLRYGLDGITPRSCEEIGIILNLSRERVRQIKNIALTKLRESSLADNLKMLYIVL